VTAANHGRILVVEDEPRYIRLFRVNLEASGYEVVTANTAQRALELASREDLDLILLDILLPGGSNGIAVCQQIRRFSSVPIIMLTALASTDDIVRGLDAGADDYITKPLSIQVLLARIRARLRHLGAPSEESASVCRSGSLALDTASRQLYARGKEVLLTPTEYRMLLELMTHPGRVLITSYLLERVWDIDRQEPHLVWQVISRLRQKLERDPSDPQLIQTRPGIGYVFVPDGDDATGGASTT
jgi:DNA-binding response OmpR family regulator